MKKKWVIKPRGSKDEVEALSKQLNIHPILANLLVQRGHATFEQAKKFFRPDMAMLHDPFLMKDMDKAIDRIDVAISRKEKILIYGDYDVDGTTAVALVYTFLKKRYPLVDFYIPDRYKEGYGISNKGIDWAEKEGITLIIALGACHPLRSNHRRKDLSGNSLTYRTGCLRTTSQSTSTPRPGRLVIEITGPLIASGSFTTANSW